MMFEASRANAFDKLNNFIDQNLIDYSKLRNFDFGPKNRSNTSCLSPYITHGVSISERLALLIKGNIKFDTYEPIQISEFHMRQRYGNEPLEIDRDKEPNTLWTDENYIGQKL